MIAYLDGPLAEKELTRAVLDIRGIGIELLIPMSTYDKLPPVGERVSLKTYFHFRQDTMQLYGFYTDAEKALFRLLIASVSGVGPKLALSILSSLPVTAFCTAISNKDIKVLSRISGIGKRSAERLIIELKEKIQDIAPEVDLSDNLSSLSSDNAKAVEDAISALITLGFKPDAARKTINSLVKELSESDLQPQLLIRQALGVLNS